mmetsp:Transcript_76178/g.176715  ORF Transcript_76178/g.176715 Transcript_76178/m.176715 type:complete len:112 (+) Transcript_76178:55-390(+)
MAQGISSSKNCCEHSAGNATQGAIALIAVSCLPELSGQHFGQISGSRESGQVNEHRSGLVGMSPRGVALEPGNCATKALMGKEAHAALSFEGKRGVAGDAGWVQMLRARWS